MCNYIYRFICFSGFLIGAPCICELTELSVLRKTFIVISEAGGGNNGPPGESGVIGVWSGVVLRTTSLPISIIPGREGLSIPHNCEQNYIIKDNENSLSLTKFTLTCVGALFTVCMFFFYLIFLLLLVKKLFIICG